MTESNNVRFVEDNGKWLWKRYDAEGSVIFRSPLFNTEREAREDYDINGGSSTASSEENTSADTLSETASTTDENQSQENAPENANDATAGTAIGEQDQQQNDNDNSAGAATL